MLSMFDENHEMPLKNTADDKSCHHALSCLAVSALVISQCCTFFANPIQGIALQYTNVTKCSFFFL